MARRVGLPEDASADAAPPGRRDHCDRALFQKSTLSLGYRIRGSVLTYASKPLASLRIALISQKCSARRFRLPRRRLPHRFPERHLEIPPTPRLEATSAGRSRDDLFHRFRSTGCHLAPGPRPAWYVLNAAKPTAWRSAVPHGPAHRPLQATASSLRCHARTKRLVSAAAIVRQRIV